MQPRQFFVNHFEYLSSTAHIQSLFFVFFCTLSLLWDNMSELLSLVIRGWYIVSPAEKHMLCFNLGCIGQYSWPAAGENHKRRRVQGGERRHTACLPAWQMLALVISPLNLIYVVSYNPTATFSTRTQLLCPHRHIFIWIKWLFCCSTDIALNSSILPTNAT